MPVNEVADGTFAANQVYVIPPNAAMTSLVSHSRSGRERGAGTAIDAFLRSLAASRRSGGRRHSLRDGLRRSARSAGDRRRGRRRIRAGPGIGEVRQHAAQRHRHRLRRFRSAAGGDRRGTRQSRPRAPPYSRPAARNRRRQSPDSEKEFQVASRSASRRYRHRLQPVPPDDRPPQGAPAARIAPPTRSWPIMSNT